MLNASVKGEIIVSGDLPRWVGRMVETGVFKAKGGNLSNCLARMFLVAPDAYRLWEAVMLGS